MIALIWVALVSGIWSNHLIVGAEEKLAKIIIVGAGASGISAAAKLLENGYNDVLVLEAENRIGGRVHSVPFGKGNIDLGAQWCQGEAGNVVYELVHNDFEFGDIKLSHEKTDFCQSNGNSADKKKCAKLMDLAESIWSDHENMAKSNKSIGAFFEVNYQMKLQNKEFEDVDKELADQIADFSARGMNTLYASESWFDLSAQLNAFPDAEGNQLLTWKKHGFKLVFDFLMKKLPDPSKALPVDEKIHFNKEVTNIDWSSNQAIVRCADGSEYRADHVIVTVSLGFLKKHHLTLFTPQLPTKKVTAIENTGYGTLGKIFLQFEKPFWPMDIDSWSSYLFLWKQEDKAKVIGTEKEWLTGITGFLRVDAQPNLLVALLSGKNIKHFEEISDEQLVDDCMWLLEKFLGKSLPRPSDMRRNRWMTSKYFLGSYSFPSMKTQEHNVAPGTDLAETLGSNGNQPTLLLPAKQLLILIRFMFMEQLSRVGGLPAKL